MNPPLEEELEFEDNGIFIQARCTGRMNGGPHCQCDPMEAKVVSLKAFTDKDGEILLDECAKQQVEKAALDQMFERMEGQWENAQ